MAALSPFSRASRRVAGGPLVGKTAPAYNLIVGGVGLLTIILAIGMALLAKHWTGRDYFPDPPLFVCFAIFAYGILANVCYTGGWILELVLRRLDGDPGPAFARNSLFFGTLFSIFLTLMPVLFFALGLLLSHSSAKHP
jgi:hypothetical protein